MRVSGCNTKNISDGTNPGPALIRRRIQSGNLSPDGNCTYLFIERRASGSLNKSKGMEKMPYITVGKENSGEIDLYYEDHGSGIPVVLIHGWPLSGAAWEKQVPALLGAGFRVITYDRRGFGRSSRPAKGYTYDTFARDLDKLMTILNLNEAILVGFSMGGGEVARYLGTIGSRRVSKAVFISAIPPYLIKTKDNPAGIDGSVFEGIKKGIVADRPSFLTQFFHNFYNADILKGKLISEEVMKLSWNTAVVASPIGTLDCVTAWLTDFRKDLSKITIPVLVV